MASHGWIAGTRDEALKELNRILPLLADQYQVSPVTIPTDRDLEYQNAVQLKAIAEFLNTLLPVSTPDIVATSKKAKVK